MSLHMLPASFPCFSEAPRDFEQWRAAARPLLAAEHSGDIRIAREVMRLVQCISHYRDPGRWELMYRLVWRSLHENSRLLEDKADPDVRSALLMERAVNRECHKMHAFVRFREVGGFEGSKSYFAWFEPDHEILRRTAPFFAKRFPNMSWTIATPDGAAIHEDGRLRFVDSPQCTSLPQPDALETLWRAYYRSICNVARINPSVMRREMPQRYWKNLPETAEIAPLIRDGRSAFAREEREKDDSGESMPRAIEQALSRLPPPAEGPEACRRCDLWRHATQAVIGHGPKDAAIMLVGEQPGDEEDLRGRPFVGPAGQVLDRALVAAELPRESLFITNSVKHFKWEPRGKRRLHKRPDASEISACRFWLDAEIKNLAPRIIVALGATAMRAVLGITESLASARGQEFRHRSGARVLCTYHPSAILRAQGNEGATLRQSLVDDLKRARLAANAASRET